MKKSSFVAMLMGMVSGMFFAMGMCMALLPEWGMLKPGIICGAIGVVLALVTVFVWRKMEHKEPVHVSGKSLLTAIVSIVGVLLLGIGLCLTILGQNFLVGIPVGMLGIVVLMMLISLVKGLK